MHIVLTCSECDFSESSHSEKELMNKVIMWNHVKKAHASTAERIMKMYQTVPESLFTAHRDQVAA